MTWFEALGDHMGEAYLRYSFTKGTANEVAAIVRTFGLQPGDRLLDVGCGPGRHAIALAEFGLDVVGIDISQRFVEIANVAAANVGPPGRAAFRVVDARQLADVSDLSGQFDAVISLCQGAFGLTGGPGTEDQPLIGREDGYPARELDEAMMAGMAGVLRPGGKLAVSAFSAYFQVRYLEDGDDFDAVNGVNHEHTEVKNPDGEAQPADLWTTCYTPRELRLLARAAGFTDVRVNSVTPGRYELDIPTTESPEFLLRAMKPQA